MSERILFVDRDGTLIVEPADLQVDSLAKLRLVPGVIPALAALKRAGYLLVLVSNQDGLGTPGFPRERFAPPHEFLMELLAAQGAGFDAEFICPHLPEDGCACRKPRTGLLTEYLAGRPMDAANSFVIGDRATDLELAAAIGVGGLRLDATQSDAWQALAAGLLRGPRDAQIKRRTRETDISAHVNLDLAEPVDVRTGIGFFDHMLEQIARHGGFSLHLRCAGDLQVDEHHTVEDSALVLGEALRRALGDKRGIGRYGFVVPMDEARALVAIDLAGRPFLRFEGELTRESVGGLPTELVPHFFRSLADSLRAAVHVELSGENCHHMIESAFKGLGRALRMAIARDGDVVPSTKGTLIA